jgi:hypothetical protein
MSSRGGVYAAFIERYEMTLCPHSPGQCFVHSIHSLPYHLEQVALCAADDYLCALVDPNHQPPDHRVVSYACLAESSTRTQPKDWLWPRAGTAGAFLVLGTLRRAAGTART